MLKRLKSVLAYSVWTFIGLIARLRNHGKPVTSIDFDPWRLPRAPKVAVVGRSESALALKNYKDFDLTILVNYSDSDLVDPNFRRRVLSSQHIILVHNSMEITVSLRTARQMNLSAVVWLGLHPSTGTKRRRTTWRLNRLGWRVQYLPQDPIMRTAFEGRSAGIVAIALASLISDQVHIFGIDFYKANYIPGSEGVIAAAALGVDYQKKIVAPAAEGAFLKISSLRPVVSFVLHSYVNLRLQASNIVVIQEKRRATA